MNLSPGFMEVLETKKVPYIKLSEYNKDELNNLLSENDASIIFALLFKRHLIWSNDFICVDKLYIYLLFKDNKNDFCRMELGTIDYEFEDMFGDLDGIPRFNPSINYKLNRKKRMLLDNLYNESNKFVTFGSFDTGKSDRHSISLDLDKILDIFGFLKQYLCSPKKSARKIFSETD